MATIKEDLLAGAQISETPMGISVTRIFYISDLVNETPADRTVEARLALQANGIHIGDFHPNANLGTTNGVVVVGIRTLQIPSGSTCTMAVDYATSSDPVINSTKWVRDVDVSLKLEMQSIDRYNVPVTVFYKPDLPGMTAAEWLKPANQKKYVQGVVFPKYQPYSRYIYRRRMYAVTADQVSVFSWVGKFCGVINENFTDPKKDFGHSHKTVGGAQVESNSGILLVGPISVTSRDRYRTVDVSVEIWENIKGWRPFVYYLNEFKTQMSDVNYVSNLFGVHVDLKEADPAGEKGDSPWGVKKVFAYDQKNLHLPLLAGGLDLLNFERGLTFAR